MYIYYMIIIGFILNIITFIFMALILALVIIGRKENDIKTKYKIGDRVFYSDSNGVVEFGTITGITATTQKKLPKAVNYQIESYDKAIKHISERQVNKYYG